MLNPGEEVWLVEGTKRRLVTIGREHGTLVFVGRRAFDRESGCELTRRVREAWGRLEKKE